jgi:streptogramin lyase
MTRSSDRIRSGRRRTSRPVVEGLESRRLLAIVFTETFSNAGPATQFVDGPDGNLWYTENTPVSQGGLGPFIEGAVGSLNPTTGAVKTFPLTGSTINNDDTAGGITLGPDGNLWFTATLAGAGSNIGVINPTTGAITYFPLPSTGGGANAITAGSDGNLWFTLSSTGKIGSINPTTHAINEYPLNNAGTGPGSIVNGPDGNLWFTESLNAIGTFNPTTHQETDYAIPTANSNPTSIIRGPNGDLWFAEDGASKIASIAPATGAIVEYPIPEAPVQITAGPDGNIYFSSNASTPGVVGLQTGIGTLDPSTGATSYKWSGDDAEVFYRISPSIATGPDGNLYVSNYNGIAKALIIAPNQAAIQSVVYSDPSGQGTFTGGPLAGATVYIDLKGDGTLDPGDPSAVTNPNGYYTFLGLAPGTYTLRVVTYPGQTVTGPGGSSRIVTLTGGSLGGPATFGILAPSPTLPLAMNPAPFGTNNPDVSTAEVNGLYQIILNRAPDPPGGAAAVAYLKNGGSLQQLAADLINSPEYETGVVASYYENFLGRAGSTAEVNAWVAVMQGGMSEEKVESLFMLSTEYASLHPTQTDFVQSLYGNILGRAGSSPEVAAWVSLLTSSATESQVITGFLESSEAASRGLNGLYWSILDGITDSAAATHIASLQSGGTLANVAIAIASSGSFVTLANATVVG